MTDDATMRQVPERRQVKQALRDAGLSSRQTDALLRGGWAALVGATEAETAELRDRIDQLAAQLAPSNGISHD